RYECRRGRPVRGTLMFIIDTDIFSIFAKSGEISLLRELFGDDAAMTPAIVQEISAPIEYGYEFPRIDNQNENPIDNHYRIT
ncbi:MAG: hypothetical protein NTZ39_01225, partial [Methanoregula sp.]|nr:hypothetical protein [Methanoregula sp.]